MTAVVAAAPHKVQLNSRIWLILLSVTLACIGLIMVASASSDVAQAKFSSPFFFVQRQAIFLLAGVVVGALVYQIPLSVWQKNGVPLLFIGCALLALLFLPSVGKAANGSTRWLSLGPINIQVSEVAKFCAVVYIAGYLVRRAEEVRQSLWGVIKPLLVLGLMAFMLMKQPDFGSTVIIMTAVLAMLFLAGIRLVHFIGILSVFAAAGVSLVLLASYRIERVIGYLDPWQHQFSSGYQIVQSLIAYGRGEWFGLGLGNSLQKLYFLPEAHTDYIFSILAEEFGFFGTLIVITLYGALILVSMNIGRQAEKNQKPFNGYLVYGLSVLIGLQVLLNIGVSSSLVPPTGLTLPLLSYGGSSLLVVCVWLAMIARADYENQTAEVKPQPTKKSKSKPQSPIKGQTKSQAKNQTKRKRASVRREPVL